MMTSTSEIIGLRNAISRCGMWPDAATVEQYCAALHLARRELNRIEAIWARYSRRHHLLGAGIDAAPGRLQARHCVVRRIFDQRVEHSWMLIRDPIAGHA